MKEVKTRTHLAIQPSLNREISALAKRQGVSLSAIASAAFKILLSQPLDKKELIVEEALRAAMEATPSTSEAQLIRRLAALEVAVFSSAKKMPIVDGVKAGRAIREAKNAALG